MSSSASSADVLSKPTLWSAIPLSIGLITYLYFNPPSSFLTPLRNMLGFGSIEYTSAQETLTLTSKSSTNKKDTNLRDLVESVVPPIRLSPLLFNGHLQTIYVSSGRGAEARIHYRRRIWESDHKTYPGQFTTDWVIPKPAAPVARDRLLPPRTHNFSEDEWSALCDSNDERPLLVVLHGLSGGSHEQYVRHCLKSLTSEAGGFAAVVVNARGCCYSKITSPVLFNARATWDVRQFIKWARKQWPDRKLFAIGFSLGANILANYLGEEGEDAIGVIESAILVGNPWNLDVSNALLCSTTIGLHVYQRAMGSGLKKVFERHVKQISQNPKIDVEKVRRSKFLWEWDRNVQCASWGYPTESAYYRDASSADAALNIKIPVLALHSKDDPICNDMAIPYSEFKTTPYIVMCATSIGGHLGWFKSGGERWSNDVIYGFFSRFAKEVDGVKLPKVEQNGTAKADDSAPRPTFHPTVRRLEIPS